MDRCDVYVSVIVFVFGIGTSQTLPFILLRIAGSVSINIIASCVSWCILI